MENYKDKYVKVLSNGIGKNIESMFGDVSLLQKAYDNGDWDEVESQLQSIVEGATRTIGIVTPIMLVENEALFRMISRSETDGESNRSE